MANTEAEEEEEEDEEDAEEEEECVICATTVSKCRSDESATDSGRMFKSGGDIDDAEAAVAAEAGLDAKNAEWRLKKAIGNTPNACSINLP